jgi:hypothetical protein
MTLLTMSKLRIYARTMLQPLDETMSTLSTTSECQRCRYCLSHRPSRPLNVNALTWLALQTGNEPSTTDDYFGEARRGTRLAVSVEIRRAPASPARLPRSALCLLHGWAPINQLMAVFDWLTPAMVKIYTDKADRKRMSGQAMALLPEKADIFLTMPNVPPARVVVSHRRQALENVGQN